ncbi:MAG: hypothetical protein ACK5BL_08905 [Flavobacteriales bacterium]|jgi:hypothetical protein
MKKILSILCALATSVVALSQAAYIQPSPTGKNDTITLYINVAQTTDGTMNNALNAMLTDHPDDTVYLWTWQPAGPVVGNGDWTNSNSAMAMTKVGEKLYSMRFKPTSFYGVDATTFFTNGISCLAKLRSGNAYQGEYNGEAKTEDLNINIIPKLCDELYCVFPELAKTDDYISITYDNTQETNPAMQNLGEDDCYLFLRAEQSAFVAVNYADPAIVTTLPQLKMKYIGDGKFRITIIPSDFFGEAGILPAGFNFKKLVYYALKPGFTYATTPPTQSFSFISCD